MKINLSVTDEDIDLRHYILSENSKSNSNRRGNNRYFN
jgi:hypothetical protein